jgi:pyridoxamine 5'-phosphate oxidase family protein
MSFSDEEVAYLRSQRLARLATVAPDGQPDVVPVGFEFDGRSFTHDSEVIPRRTVHSVADPAPSPPAPRAPVE